MRHTRKDQEFNQTRRAREKHVNKLEDITNINLKNNKEEELLISNNNKNKNPTNITKNKNSNLNSNNTTNKNKFSNYKRRIASSYDKLTSSASTGIYSRKNKLKLKDNIEILKT